MQQTSNYGLNKPEQTDTVNIDDLNANFDTLDTELKKVSDKANLIQTAGGTGTAITLTNVNLINGFTITFVVAVNNNGAATTINGKSLYKPGGTAAPTLTAGKAVTVWYNGTNFFIKASAEGNAVAADVLAGKTFSNDADTGLAGAMANNGPASAETVNLTTEGAEYTIPAGYHSGLRKIKAAITNITAAVIKAGTTVGGIVGTFTADATATAAQMLSGVTAYVNGNKITGTIASKSATTYNPSTSAQTIPAGQYLSGTQTIAATTGTAVAGDVLAGKTFNSANGIGLTGNIPAQGSGQNLAWSNANADTGVDVYPTKGYWDGSQWLCINDVNLIPSNILAGKSIFGVAGAIPIMATDNRCTLLGCWNYNGEPAYSVVAQPPKGYYDGVNNTINVYDSNFIAANILNTVSLFGLQGTAIAGKRFASGSFNSLSAVASAPSSISVYQFSGSLYNTNTLILPISALGLNFTPSIIYLIYEGWIPIIFCRNGFPSNRSESYQEITPLFNGYVKYINDPTNYICLTAAYNINYTWYAWE